MGTMWEFRHRTNVTKSRPTDKYFGERVTSTEDKCVSFLQTPIMETK